MSAKSFPHSSEEDDQANATRKGYDGEDRRSWQGEAAVLHGRLDRIEELARGTHELARSTHDSVISHVAEERETKAAIDELILLWRGSKLMIAAFKFSIPIIAALIGAAMWAKDHLKL
ncbi:hypothetical protein [Candidatus Accumulibacter vicinus]|uniref:Uncharacterized protein n=1 Tax=Candidatus Accumulibacter vicinus TaxID=2954382 RepID=A0A084Y2H0_9PROT|nr:hypothetical protein [Candidatus Accumulibacter vicinus]KFB68914.1 MAG: hypothetical protein CAPSK01_001769 [Candidatus Accumulibacter vicinus]